MGSIFIGMIISQIIGGWLSIIFGPKFIIGFTLVLASLLTLISPLASDYGYIWLIFVRFSIGILQVNKMISRLFQNKLNMKRNSIVYFYHYNKGIRF